MNIDKNKFTVIEQKLLELLSDGHPHATKQLMDILKQSDIAADAKDLQNRLFSLRSKLLETYDLNVLHKVEGKRVNYVLVKQAVVHITDE